MENRLAELKEWYDFQTGLRSDGYWKQSQQQSEFWVAVAEMLDEFKKHVSRPPKVEPAIVIPLNRPAPKLVPVPRTMPSAQSMDETTISNVLLWDEIKHRATSRATSRARNLEQLEPPAPTPRRLPMVDLLHLAVDPILDTILIHPLYDKIGIFIDRTSVIFMF